MTQQDKQHIIDLIENEGVDYAFNYASDFSDISDSTFHELLKNYRDSRQALLDYIDYEE